MSQRYAYNMILLMNAKCNLYISRSKWSRWQQDLLQYKHKNLKCSLFKRTTRIHPLCQHGPTPTQCSYGNSSYSTLACVWSHFFKFRTSHVQYGRPIDDKNLGERHRVPSSYGCHWAVLSRIQMIVRRRSSESPLGEVILSCT